MGDCLGVTRSSVDFTVAIFIGFFFQVFQKFHFFSNSLADGLTQKVNVVSSQKSDSSEKSDFEMNVLMTRLD